MSLLSDISSEVLAIRELLYYVSEATERARYWRFIFGPVRLLFALIFFSDRSMTRRTLTNSPFLFARLVGVWIKHVRFPDWHLRVLMLSNP